MKLGYSIVSAGFITLFPLFSALAIDKPVTAADLTGRSFCWTSGDRDTYSPGGKFESKHWGKGTWQMMADGVVSIKTETAGWIASIQKLADGSFETRNNYHGIYSGHYCN